MLSEKYDCVLSSLSLPTVIVLPGFPLHDTSKTDITTINPAAILLIVIPLKVMTSIVSLINYRYHVKRTQPNQTLLIMVLEHEALKELLTVTMEL
jgi:hypothetical protein